MLLDIIFLKPPIWIKSRQKWSPFLLLAVNRARKEHVDPARLSNFHPWGVSPPSLQPSVTPLRHRGTHSRLHWQLLHHVAFHRSWKTLHIHEQNMNSWSDPLNRKSGNCSTQNCRPILAFLRLKVVAVNTWFLENMSNKKHLSSFLCRQRVPKPKSNQAKSPYQVSCPSRVPFPRMEMPRFRLTRKFISICSLWFAWLWLLWSWKGSKTRRL